jgi:hypothetical protein
MGRSLRCKYGNSESSQIFMAATSARYLDTLSLSSRSVKFSL